MNNSQATQKAVQRAEMLRKKESVSDRNQKDAQICARIVEMPEVKLAEALLCYVSRDDEISTTELIRIALERGKRVFAPKIEGQKMRFYSISSFEDLKPASFGLLEPIAGEKFGQSMAQKAVCIVPAIACDKSFCRLGFGGGYYDRFLDGHRLFTVAPCYDELLVDKLPRESWDKEIDAIITPSATLRRDIKKT